MVECISNQKSCSCSCENGKELASIINKSAIICHEIIEAKAKSYDEETKTVITNFNEKNDSVKQKIYIFYLLF